MEHCCESMKSQINQVCDDHTDPFECPDKLIYYDNKFNEYGIIIRDGGRSYTDIYFCPWCGIKLPESKRNLWFDTLNSLGYDDPTFQVIPEEFRSDEWYRQNK